LISDEVYELAIAMRQLETYPLLTLKDVAVCGEKPCDIRLDRLLDSSEVIVANEIPAPPPPAWVLPIKPLSSAVTLIVEQTRLAIRMAAVGPAAICVEVFV